MKNNKYNIRNIERSGGKIELDPKYKTIVKELSMTNKNNPDLVVTASTVINEYFYYLEEGFPKDYEVYELFVKLANE